MGFVLKTIDDFSPNAQKAKNNRKLESNGNNASDPRIVHTSLSPKKTGELSHSNSEVF